jgi:hypothetical protein
MTYEGSATTRLKIIEVDTGYKNNINDSTTVIVIDPDIAATSVIMATQAGLPATDKDYDEGELDHFIVKATPSSDGGSMTVVMLPMPGVTLSGKYKITYVIG